ncbi:MAG: hypothetical protein COC05_07270 [Gammaproteobacteria bacterium]|nr:MAG: hypothetical protein COC05_07270 [Gammaproteobacteria bacterium]
MDFILTGGEKADCTQAIPLIESKKYGVFLADKGYDSDAIVAHIRESEALCVIPPKRTEKFNVSTIKRYIKSGTRLSVCLVFSNITDGYSLVLKKWLQDFKLFSTLPQHCNG